MLGAVAVASWAAGAALVARNQDTPSALLTAIGELLIGLAALLTMIASWLTGRKNGRRIDATQVLVAAGNVAAGAAAAHAQTAAAQSAEAVLSLGPANGDTIRDLLVEIRTNNEYQHKRNHDILAAVTPLAIAQPQLVAALARHAALLEPLPALLERLTEHLERLEAS